MTLKFKNTMILNGSFMLGLLDLHFRAGAVTVVIGPNGSGKSTLLRAAAGLLPARSGSIRLLADVPVEQASHSHAHGEPTRRSPLCVNHQDLSRLEPKKRARLISFVPQRPESVAGFTVRTSVELGRVAMHADAERVQIAMRRAGIDTLADELVGRLSEGQRHRVAFARSLAQRCEESQLLIVDEPTSALDPTWTRELARELRHSASEGLTVIVATHDFAFAGAIADDVVALEEDERVSWFGDPGAISKSVVAAAGNARDILVPTILQPIFNVPFRMVDQLATGPLCLPIWDDSIRVE